MEQFDFSWMDEIMEDIPDARLLYKILCFVLGRRKRKFSYREWYIILSMKLGQTIEGNKFAINKVIDIYKRNNNKEPNINKY